MGSGARALRTGAIRDTRPAAAPSPEGWVTLLVRAVKNAISDEERRSLEGLQSAAEIGRATGVRC